MRKWHLGVCLLVCMCWPLSVEASSVLAMQRLYNPNSGEHFYTASITEQQMLVDLGWQAEGVAWNAPLQGLPVYRVYNKEAGDHHYTVSEVEKAQLVALGWQDEGVGWYAASKGQAVYRAYNPYAKTGTHHYTTSQAEIDQLCQLGWQDEGVAWYSSKQDLTLTPTQLEQEIAQDALDLVKAYRATRALFQLVPQVELAQGAFLRSRELSEYDTSVEDQQKLAAHLRPDGQSFVSIYQELNHPEFTEMAENIAIIPTQSTAKQTAQLAIDTLANSQQGHRETMESTKYTDLGIGVSQTATQTIVVQHFAKK
ncbi:MULTISPECIES: CAP domain-containing protein [Enterococcus]|uniref:Uncharacterized protein n=1 Tax=Enterococcus sulfureus ATCC 49903 TaxID=1140003 RepID=S0PFL5_9ENTE|nr:CAP domain-containing protein [Enterococcus sulfureus]EOT49354.1 hypothetical protein OMY_00282 [Enterococcus sulfureus ATCC 49903]EOT87221.1 hypothetical protein I573_00277 [Enterococcus sulfureus ATCC 49903]